MLWLGLHLPQLALDLFRRSLSGGPAFAICDRLTVLQACDEAIAQGVHPGMKRASALALAPGLLLLDRDPSRERLALEQVAAWALQFTPSVSLQPARLAAAAAAPTASDEPIGLLLEVEPSLRLFGGLQALLAQLRSGLQMLGFGSSIAAAPTAGGAWLLARHDDGIVVTGMPELASALAELPVQLLEHARPRTALLESLGVRSIAQLGKLPRAGLARRLGKELLAELDRAYGRIHEPRLWFEAPSEFHVRMELLAQVEHAEALLFAARRLLAQLTGWLLARHAATRALQLVAEHDDHPDTVLQLRLAEPSRELARLVALLREHLNNTRLPEAAHTLVLHCTSVETSTPDTASLFPTQSGGGDGLGPLIERLQARLGNRRVQRLQLAADHRPEAAYRFEHVERLEQLGTASAADDDNPAGLSTLPRPLWLLRQPIALAERAQRPYWNSHLNLLAGPERIETGWWDGHLVQRDYFIAEDEAHTLYWIFRERPSAAGSGGGGWFLQGKFG